MEPRAFRLGERQRLFLRRAGKGLIALLGPIAFLYPLAALAVAQEPVPEREEVPLWRFFERETELTRLVDADAGGFFSGEVTDTESITPRRKPIEDNAVAARFLFLLG